MTPVQLTTKFANADLGLISITAKTALTTERVPEFLLSIKEQLVRDAPESTHRIMGPELYEAFRSHYDLPYIQGHQKVLQLSPEQLTQKFADADLPLYSKSAIGAIKAGRCRQYLEGMIAMQLEHPRVSHGFIGDELSVLIFNYIKQYDYEGATVEEAK